MTLPPYIPGLAAVLLATAAALGPGSISPGSISPEQAEALSEVGFLRWLLVVVTGGGGVILWRVLTVLEGLRALLSAQATARDALLMDAAKEALKP